MEAEREIEPIGMRVGQLYSSIAICSDLNYEVEGWNDIVGSLHGLIFTIGDS